MHALIINFLPYILIFIPNQHQHQHQHQHLQQKKPPPSFNFKKKNSHHSTSGNGTVSKTGPYNNGLANESWRWSSGSGGIGGSNKSIGVGGTGIGVDVEIFGVVIGGDDDGIGFVIRWGGETLLLLLLMKGEKDPIWVLNRGLRIRGEGRVVVEELGVKGMEEVVEDKFRKFWFATGVVGSEFGRMDVG